MSSGRNIEGWVDIWDSNPEKMREAVSRACSLRSVTEEEYDVKVREKGRSDGSMKTITIELKEEELRRASIVIQRLLKDLNIKAFDKTTVEVTIDPTDTSFQVTIKPDEITDERIGITLSSLPGTGAIIAQTDDSNKSPLGVRSSPFGSSAIVSGRVERVRKAYGGISECTGGEFAGRSNPYKIEIITSLAKWSCDLTKSRKRPQTP